MHNKKFKRILKKKKKLAKIKKDKRRAQKNKKKFNKYLFLLLKKFNHKILM